jgi:hypothetical protein
MPPKRPKKARRWIVVLIIIVGLLVGVDFGAAAASEYAVAKAMKTKLGLTDLPSVTVHGFPFLTQAARGVFSDISVSASGVPVGDRLSNVAIQAELNNVHVSMSELLSGNTSNVKVDDLTGSVQVRADDIGRLLNLPDLTMNAVPVLWVLNASCDPSTPSTATTTSAKECDETTALPADVEAENKAKTIAGVKLTSTTDIAGVSTKITAYSIISLQGSKIQFTTKRLAFANDQIAATLAGSVLTPLMNKFSLTLNPGNLPFGVVPTQVSGGTGTVTIYGEAKNVLLSQV